MGIPVDPRVSKDPRRTVSRPPLPHLNLGSRLAVGAITEAARRRETNDVAVRPHCNCDCMLRAHNNSMLRFARPIIRNSCLLTYFFVPLAHITRHRTTSPNLNLDMRCPQSPPWNSQSHLRVTLQTTCIVLAGSNRSRLGETPYGLERSKKSTQIAMLLIWSGYFCVVVSAKHM